MGFGGKVGKNTPLMLLCLPVAHGAFSENSVFVCPLDTNL